MPFPHLSTNPLLVTNTLLMSRTFCAQVGATQGVPETTATFSSGGFSNYFGTPSYQGMPGRFQYSYQPTIFCTLALVVLRPLVLTLITTHRLTCFFTHSQLLMSHPTSLSSETPTQGGSTALDALSQTFLPKASASRSSSKIRPALSMGPVSSRFSDVYGLLCID